MALKILGIDPGSSNAALAIVEVAGGAFTLIDAIDAPTIGEDHRKVIDVVALGRWALQHKPDRAVIERAQAMPSMPDPVTGERRGQGASSTFKYGKGCGALEAMVMMLTLCGHDVPLLLVETRRWKNHFSLPGGKENKEKARQLAIARFPYAAGTMLRFKYHHNRAEAALIALFACEHFGDCGETRQAG